MRHNVAMIYAVTLLGVWENDINNKSNKTILALVLSLTGCRYQKEYFSGF
jgi:hypothetical protein